MFNFKVFMFNRFVYTSIIVGLFTIVALPVVADEFDLTVNGKTIPRNQLEALYKDGLKEQTDPVKLKQLIRQDTIRREVLAQEAIREKIDQDIDFQIRRDISIRYALASAYMAKKMQVEMTDDEIRKAYDEIVEQASSRQEYAVSHILVDDEARAQEISKILKEDPTQFEDIAMEESKDPGSAKNGGKLGWVIPGALVPEFEAVMIRLKNNQISDPVKTQYGYHIITVQGQRKASPPPFSEIKDRLKAQMLRERAEQFVEALVKKATIQ